MSSSDAGVIIVSVLIFGAIVYLMVSRFIFKHEPKRLRVINEPHQDENRKYSNFMNDRFMVMFYLIKHPNADPNRIADQFGIPLEEVMKHLDFYEKM